MNPLAFFYKNGLWLSWPAIITGAILLLVFITAVVRLGPKNRLETLPLVSEQKVFLGQPGKIVLWAEGPALSRRFWGLSYELLASDGTPVRSSRSIGRQNVSTFTRSRVVVRIFTVPAPGEYTLKVSDLGSPQAADENHSLVFMRPHMPKAIGCILGIVLGSFLVIGGLVNFLLRLLQGAR